MNTILIFGGTFDPPHNGHLKTVLDIQSHFHFKQVLFLPCKNPVLKHSAQASATDRLNMLNLMLKPYSEFSISTIELDRETPSYMTETLLTLRDHYGPDASLTLLVGMDTFMNLNQWYQWEKIPALCNLLVMKRPGISEHDCPDAITRLFNDTNHSTHHLLSSHAGRIAYVDAGQYPISSTDLREKIHTQVDISNDVPEAVETYIKLHELYR